MAEKIQKIYELQETGGEHVISVVNQINKEFAELRRTKVALNNQAIRESINGETEASKKLLAQLQALTVKELELKTKRQELINQSKELQLVRQQELQQQRQSVSGNNVLAGSYNDVAKQYRELQRIVKATPEGQNVTLADGSVIKYREAIKELKRLAAAEQDYRRQFTRDGTLVGEYKSGIIDAFQKAGLTDLIQNQLTQAKTKVRDLNAEFDKLKAELREVQRTGQGSLEVLEQQLIENRTAAGQLTGQIGTLEQGLRGTGTIGQQITDSLKNSFKDLGRQIVQVALGYVGFQAAIGTVQKAVRLNYDLSDKYSDLQRVLAATDEEFESIIEHIRAINTRTPLAQLADFAFIAAKAGVAKNEIAGVTEALDQLYIVAGKSLGDPEQTFESLVKLNTIFNNGAPVTAENLQKLGNAIIQLDNAGVASGGYIVDFAQRLAGIEGITKIAITSVLGLAAAFEENGASAEVAATAVSQVIVKLYSDTAKYAEIAGVTKQAFEDLLNSNPGEALLLVSAGLKGNAQTATEFAESFSDLEAKGVRVQAVMGTLADKTDYFRQKIKLASSAIKDNSSIQEEAGKKQKNFAASVDQIRKSFELFLSSATVVDILNNGAAAIKVLIYLLPIIIKLFSLWIAGWIALNTQMLVARARLIGYTIALALLNKAQTLVNIGLFAYNAVIGASTGLTTVATAATRLWGLAMNALPIGWLITIIGALIAILVSVGAAFAGNTDSLRANALATKLNGQIQEEVSKQTAGTIAKINAYTAALKDNTLSHEARKKALEALIAISPEYLGRLTLENIATAEGTKIINDYVEALKKKAQATALDEALTDAQKRKNQSALEEMKVATDPNYAKQKYKELGGGFFASLADAAKYGTFDSEQAFLKDYFQKQQKEAQSEIDIYTGMVKKDIKDSTKDIKDTSGKSLKETIGARQKVLEEQIKNLKAAYKGLALTDKKGQADNIAQRKKAQEELDALDEDKNGKEKKERPYGGAKLTGETKDELKEIEAQTALQKAALEQRKLEGKISETDYQIELNKITQKGIADKLAIIKDGNAEEKKQRAELKLEAVKSTQEMNEELLKIEENRLTKGLESSKRAAENALKLVTDDARSTDVQKAQAQIDFDEKMIAAQINYGAEMDKLEKKYGVTSMENAQKRADDLLEIKRKEVTDQTGLNEKVYNALFKALDDSEKGQTTKVDTQYFNDLANLSAEQFNNEERRKRKLEELERNHQQELLEIQRAGINARLLAEEYMHLGGYTNEKDYNEKILELQRQLAANTADLNDNTQKGIMSSWDNFKGSLGEFLKVAQDVYQQVIQPLFDLQSQKIDNEQKETEAQQEEAKKRELNKATSESEKQKIEDKYAAIKDQNDKKYAEQRKKVALKQLAIESGLAAIKALLSLPNYIQVALNLGLVAANYAIQKSKIESTSFEKGGSLKRTLNRGGRFNGPSHRYGGIPFSLDGAPIEVEGDEGFVVNKRSMASNTRMTVTGTPAQIASASNVAGGGHNFAPGARVMRYEYGGSLGMSLKAPVIIPRFSSSNSTTGNEDISALKDMVVSSMEAVIAVSSKVEMLRVELNPNTVTNFQIRQSKAVDLSTL